MRVCLIGCVEFSEKALVKLLDLESRAVCEIVGVVTKSNSEFNSDFVDLGVTLAASDFNDKRLHYYSNEKSLVEFLMLAKPDVIYCFGWSNLLSKDVLIVAPKGVIGFHPAALPKNRGRHPIIWALVLGLIETASTFFRMDEGADSGEILSQERLTISCNDDARSLYDKIVQVAIKQIEAFTILLANNDAILYKQDHRLANYWRKRSAKDGLIDWRMDATDIHNLVRALTKPYPGAEFLLHGNVVVKIWKSSMEMEEIPPNFEPGKVLSVMNEKVLVKCAGTTAIWLERTEPALVVEEGEYL